MSENIKKDIKVEDKASVKPKRFTINVDSGKDEAGNKQSFIFTGPEKASLGLIYDAAHRIMMEVISILQKRAEELRPKKESEIKKEDVGVKTDKDKK